MEQKKPNVHIDPGTWQTGRTEPPKRHSALISILLVLVILLSGISTALSIMNLKLYRKLNTVQDKAPVAFSRSSEVPDATETVHEEVPVLQNHLGISGTVIPLVYQRYYHLPGGIYVSRGAEKSEAQEKGLVAGDIITAVNGTSVQEAAQLELLAESLSPGDSVELTLYRSGTELSVTLTWNAFE